MAMQAPLTHERPAAQALQLWPITPHALGFSPETQTPLGLQQPAQFEGRQVAPAF
jgi:hypothetical protein